MAAERRHTLSHRRRKCELAGALAIFLSRTDLYELVAVSIERTSAESAAQAEPATLGHG